MPHTRCFSRHTLSALVLSSIGILCPACTEPPTGTGGGKDMGMMGEEDMAAVPDRLVLLIDEAPVGDIPLEVEREYDFGLRALDENGNSIDTSSAVIEIADLDDSGEPIPGPALTVYRNGERLWANEIGRVRVTARLNGQREELELEVGPRRVELNEPMPLTVVRQGTPLSADLLLATRKQEGDGPVVVNPVLSMLCGPLERSVSGSISLSSDGKTLTPEYVGIGKLSLDCSLFGTNNGDNRERDYHFKILPEITTSAGKDQTCAVRGSGPDASLRCWGRNDKGQLGTSVQADAPIPTPVQGIIAPLTVDMASEHGCAVDGLGDIHCWGDNTFGRVSPTAEETILGPTVFSHPRVDFVDVCTTDATTCGLSERGRLICWGTNNQGLLGTSLGVGARVEEHIEPFPTRRFATVSCGGAHMCGTTFEDESVCWGSNDRGQVGAAIDDPVVGQPRAIASPLQGTVYGNFSLSAKSTCAVTLKGDLYCWGDNSSKQLSGAVTNDSTNTPKVLQGIYLEGGDEEMEPAYVDEVAVGATHTCANLRADRGLRCWGSNVYGQLATTPTTETEGASNPTELTAGLEMRALAVGDRHSCGFDGSTLRCWGDYANGRLGTGGGQVGLATFDAMASSFPDFAALGSAVDVALGESHGCAILEDVGGNRSVRCWGSNAKRQLHVVDKSINPPFGAIIADVVERPPNLHPDLSGSIVDISAGARHTCYLGGLGMDDMLAGLMPPEYTSIGCWGDSEFNQAGRFDPNSPGLFRFSAPNGSSLVPGEEAETNQTWGGLALKLGETSSCGLGQFHTEKAGNRFPGVPPEQEVFKGSNPVCWGRGALGELGLGSNQIDDDIEAPDKRVAIGNDGPFFGRVIGVKQLQCAWENGGPIQTRIFCWGRDPNGVMKNWGEDVPIEDRGWFKPEEVAGSKDIPGIIEGQFAMQDMGIGIAHACAVRFKSTGTSLACWGHNDRGQLGSPDSPRVAFKNQVILDIVKDPVHVAVGHNHTCASTSNNEIYCWGDNRFGQSGAVDTLVGVQTNSHSVTEPNRVFDGGSAEVVGLFAGANNSCALLKPPGAGGITTIHCWGENSTGQSQWKGMNSWSRTPAPQAVTWN